jgi:RNA polymerase sigma factor (sigma-70 family)
MKNASAPHPRSHNPHAQACHNSFAQAYTEPNARLENTLSDLTLKEEQLQSADPLLLAFLRADEAETETALSKLINDESQLVIKSTIRRRIGAYGNVDCDSTGDDEDLYHEAVLQLITQLRNLKNNPNQKSIKDFRSYTAVVAHNVCHQYLREKYPNRSRLKNRIRYLLTHRQDFFVQAEEQGLEQRLVCGFAGWRYQRDPASPPDVERALIDPEALARAGLETTSPHTARLDYLLTALFNAIDAPVELDLLVSVVAQLQGVKDQPPLAEVDESATALIDRLPDQSPGAATELEQRSYLRRLWSEIKELPPRQRAALLLNPGDVHEDVISLLLFTGAASLREIGAALEIGPDDFASLWRQLPLDDLTIAARLSVTRQQVINLRKSARERLARRMKAFE